MKEEKAKLPRSIEQSIATGRERTVGPFGSDAMYYKTLQGPLVNNIISSLTTTGVQLDAIAHTAELFREGNKIIRIDERALDDLSDQAIKVLIILNNKATEQLPQKANFSEASVEKNRTVKISIGEFMTACGIADRTSARDQLNAGVRTLFGVSYDWQEVMYIPQGGKRKDKKEEKHYSARIIEMIGTMEGGNPIKRGTADIVLAPKYAEYLALSYYQNYPSSLLKINSKLHPYSISLGWKLSAMYNMDIGKNTQGKTTVSTLLKAVKKFPRYNPSKGQAYQRIIHPFDRDMRELVDRGILSGYAYYDGMGNRVLGLATLSYAEFAALNVRYTMAGYPDQTTLIEAKQGRIAAAETRAARSAKKKEA